MSAPRTLDQYRLLGRTGLRISPLAPGTMTFEGWDWGSDETESRRIFDTYIDRGGNLTDTAMNYTNDHSERIVGAFAKDKRKPIVLATKFTMTPDLSNINSGGNHRYNPVRSMEARLRQLDTDRIDLLYLDQLARLDEVSAVPPIFTSRPMVQQQTRETTTLVGVH